MTWQVRKSKSFGGLRFTAGKRGISTSFGWGPFRISRGADGKTRRTVRIPKTGLYQTEVINQTEGKVYAAPTSDGPWTEVGDLTAPSPKRRRRWPVVFLAASVAFLVFVILI